MSEEVEHIHRSDLARILRDHREEHLQIERHRPQRVRPRPASDELQIPVNERITKPIPHLTRGSRRAHQEGETSHDRTLAAPQPAAR
jgi:hypothetical protein